MEIIIYTIHKTAWVGRMSIILVINDSKAAKGVIEIVDSPTNHSEKTFILSYCNQKKNANDF